MYSKWLFNIARGGRCAHLRFTSHLGEDAAAVRGDQVGVEVLEGRADDRRLVEDGVGPVRRH